MKLHRAGALLLVVLGVLTLGTGLHFLFVRPPMLPEDVRFTGIEPRLLSPRMLEWLRVVFRTWGGFLAGFGVLLASVGAHLLTRRPAPLYIGTALAVSVAFGGFLASNIQLQSDYLPFIGLLFMMAVSAAACLLAGTDGWAGRRSQSPLSTTGANRPRR
jgi:hypothetical protein